MSEFKFRRQRVLDTARRLVADTRCHCHECWTGRGRHDPRGCTWEDIAELRAAVELVDAKTCAE